MTAAVLVARAEHALKGRVWDCQMCGQCVLHGWAVGADVEA